mmetsp:Transcript_26718/g.29569  ORF Transcript_26718/g.29569 Transcript_26718/m.29569 type:complete len:120 (+) Transcript_26718:291-650(+)
MLFDAMSQKAIDKLDTFSSQGIATTVWAYASIGTASPILFDAILHRIIFESSSNTFNSQEIANIVWAYAKVGSSSTESLLFDTMSKRMKKVNDFKPQDVTTILWAYAKVGHIRHTAGIT